MSENTYSASENIALSDPRLNMLREANGTLKLTEQQARAVLERGNILVSAAAGAGKTATLVKRILLSVAEGAFSLKEALVCVYNDSAQAELRQRLHAELIRCAIAESDPERRARLLKAIDDLPFCRISTIHAFCASLIRENFEKLGISPVFEIADDAKAAALMDMAIDAAFDEFVADGDEKFLQLVEIFALDRNEEGLKIHVRKMYERLIMHSDREKFKADATADFQNSPLHAQLYDCYRRRLREAKNFADPLLVKVRSTPSLCKRMIDVPLGQAAEAIDALLAADDFYGMCETASRLDPFASHKSVTGLEEGSDERETFYIAKACVVDMGKIIGPLCETYAKWEDFKRYHVQNVEFTAKLIEITERAEKFFEAAKAEKNLLTYQDLLVLAARLLKEYPELGGEFKIIFVDEYQDVDPLQESIFASLVSGESFMVGDVKQSIYGFRLADPKILLDRKSAYLAGGGKVIDFNGNFRSDPEILRFVNQFFDPIMTEDSADVDYKREGAFDIGAAKKASQDAAPQDVPPEAEDGSDVNSKVRICLFQNAGGAERDDGERKGLYDITADEGGPKLSGSMAIADRQANYIVAQINRLVGHALKADSDRGEKLSYGDIAILSRNTAIKSPTLTRVLDALKEAGIPVDETNVGSNGSEAERELMLMLKALDNPRQDIPFVGFLLSYFGGFDEQELADISAEQGETFYDKFCAASRRDGALAQKARDALDTLDEYRLKASFKNVGELMQSITADYMYDAHMLSLGEGNLVDLKNFIAAASEVSLGRFLEEYEKGQSKATSAIGDSVKVSTIHKFKGLESSVVFLLDFTKPIKEPAEELIFLDSGAVGMKYYDFATKSSRETFSRFAAKKLVKAKNIKEEMRLMYVALTRAKQLMYILEAIPKSYKFGADPCLDGVSDTRDFLSLAKLRGSLKKDPHPIDPQFDPHVERHAPVMNFLPSPELKEKLLAARSKKYPDAATHIAMKYSVSQIGALDDAMGSLFAEGDGQAAIRGTAYHKVMQNIDLGATDAKQVDAQLADMTERGILSNEERNMIDPADILRCLQSPLMRTAYDAYLKGECEREKPFTMLKPARELELADCSDEVLVQGVIDMYLKGDKQIIVDFKTGYIDENNIPQRYKKQLELYKMAVEAALGVKVNQVCLFCFKTGKAIEL